GGSHVALALPQRHRGSGEGPTRTDRADETVDPSVGLAPYLRPGRVDVALAVGDIVELVGPDGAVRLALRQLFREALRDVDVVVRVLVGDGGHLAQFSAAEPQHVLLFFALR